MLLVKNQMKNLPSPKNLKFINTDASIKYTFDERIDFIIHAAGIASPFYYRAMPLETLDVAINGTRNALDLAREHDSKVIFFSSSEIYGDPDSQFVPTPESYRGNVNTLGPRACYDESKRIGETLCYIYNKTFKVNVNIIRPFNIFGPGMQQKDYRILPNFADKILKNQSLNVYGSGKQTRTYCYINDALEGFLRVMLFGISGEVYNIGRNEPEVSVVELCKIISKILDKQVSLDHVDYPESYPTDEPQRRCPEISKAKKDLGYIPRVDLNVGFKKIF